VGEKEWIQKAGEVRTANEIRGSMTEKKGRKDASHLSNAKKRATRETINGGPGAKTLEERGRVNLTGKRTKKHDNKKKTGRGGVVKEMRETLPSG